MKIQHVKPEEVWVSNSYGKDAVRLSLHLGDRNYAVVEFSTAAAAKLAQDLAELAAEAKERL